MKKIFFAVFVLLCTTYVLAIENKTVIQDQDGKSISATFNDKGIITALKGSVDNFSVTSLNISTESNLIRIKMKSSGDGCFEFTMEPHDTCIKITKIFTEVPGYFPPRDNLTYTIYFDKNDKYLLKDDYISIDKVIKTSVISANPKDSLLPLIKYKNNVLIQYFGVTIPPDDPGSRKYEYSPDKKNVICSHIMPGDVFEKFMTVSVFDIKSKDITVNAVNYLILHSYNSMIGAILFPILFDLDGRKSGYLETDITADSYLTEGNVKYLPSRLKDTTIETPWCEGLKGDGIGSRITIKAKTDISTLIISNGFDSIKKYIYYNNNRVKQIKITDLNNKKNFIITKLPDSVEPFEIHLPFSTKQLEIEILSVYKGEKYEDTCLNYILAK